jgi:transcriptional regulator with XRE-family HTH domain
MTHSKLPLHQVCKQMKDLRLACGLTLAEAATLAGVAPMVLGSYERGDRRPPLDKLEIILNSYGYTVAAVPRNFKAVQLPGDMAATLRTMAEQLERLEHQSRKRNGVQSVPEADDRPRRHDDSPSLIPGL